MNSHHSLSLHSQDIDECEIFGSCSQKCKNTPGSFFCECVAGFSLKSDKTTCQPQGGDVILTYNTRKQIISRYLAANSSHIVASARQAIGLWSDGETYYWTDISEKREAIVKLTVATQKKETIINSGLELPEDVSVDWLTGNIYFTDGTLGHVGVCTSTGSYCTVLLKLDHIEQPRAVALHPQLGLLFWSDWGAAAHIGVAFMDGSEPRILVDKLSWPNALTVDWPSGRLYWGDAFAHKIESITINGEDRRVVASENVNHPYSMAVIGNRLFWSDWDTGSIKSCDKFTGKSMEVMVAGDRYYGELNNAQIIFFRIFVCFLHTL